MPFPRPLALCAGLACAGLAFPSLATAAAPSSARDDALAEIGSYRDQARWVDALAAIERAQQQTPDDPLLYRLQVLTLGDIGSAGRAWHLYQARPDLFDDAQKQRLEADYLARRVNWSLAYSKEEDRRLDEAEAALAEMDRYPQRDGLQHDGMPVTQAPLRIRIDRLVLLNRLGRHAQLLAETEQLQQQGHALPDYVLPALGDSLMALQRPTEAIGPLSTAVANDPSRSASRSQLAYAYLESEQAERAIDHLQAWQKDAPTWRRGGGAEPYANWARHEADLNLALIRAYSGDLPAAQHALEARVAIGPANSGLQTALGSVYQMRGWPRRGLERQQMAQTLDPRDVAPRLGMHEAYVQLQRDDLARPLHDALLQQYPDQPGVKRMDRDWRAHRGWRLQAQAEGGRSSGGGGSSPLGSDDLQYRTEVASPVFDDRWRVFAFLDRRAVNFQQQRIDPLWTGAGLRYRFEQADAEAAVVHANDGIGGTGLRAGFGWQFDDHWHASVVAARNDPDASMQARVAGISADSIGVNADYTRDERSRWSMAASRFRYDDGNRRDSLSLAAEQRLLTRSRLLVDGLGSLYTSRGSDDDAPYFNPSRDRSMEIGLRVDQLLWRRYEHHLRHRLTVSVGNYWQHGFGDAFVPTLAYRHEWQFGPGRVLEYGVSWSRPVYDGRRERHIGFDAALRWGQ
ncbi:poly-beta-1,6 N-acetyl-D-glucosamine export porin PgaA [Stenotrophomonas sp.]|uniref:poly-beta-1,6 N-acetyl-D-glucosamine export porin PgaA n=1 Tax=Stenotrophomonas sp. TaxID=69392 RepID=UPI002D38815F|nr:poly-beta-1,6 N-acetyl-D-glucosamine export porin PgaA [Stenotrophomonas sp.]HYQ22135.1 poly-beta-1,6 N-acetyl-D-glucosamine export porin PgaA [Stenotrophomonas sp.]